MCMPLNFVVNYLAGKNDGIYNIYKEQNSYINMYSYIKEYFPTNKFFNSRVLVQH